MKFYFGKPNSIDLVGLVGLIILVIFAVSYFVFKEKVEPFVLEIPQRSQYEEVIIYDNKIAVTCNFGIKNHWVEMKNGKPNAHVKCNSGDEYVITEEDLM